MNRLFQLMLLPALLCAAQSASASIMSVDDLYDPAKDILLASYTSRHTAEWKHDITDEGFSPTTDTIIDAKLDITLRDYQDSIARRFGSKPEDFKITLDGDFLGSHAITYNTGFAIETIYVDVAYLQSDGMLNVKIRARSGDFYLVSSNLHVTFNRPMPGGGGGTTVPEPASALLLGLGLAATGLGLRRRKAA